MNGLADTKQPVVAGAGAAAGVAVPSSSFVPPPPPPQPPQPNYLSKASDTASQIFNAITTTNGTSVRIAASPHRITSLCVLGVLIYRYAFPGTGTGTGAGAAFVLVKNSHFVGEKSVANRHRWISKRGGKMFVGCSSASD